jgi:hypothetical protein
MKTAALVLLALLPVPLAAQGLGDAAAKEHKKREQSKAAPRKVFTDSDLSGVPPSDQGDPGSTDTPARVAPSGASDEGSASEPSSPSKSKDPGDPLEKERQDRKLLEAEWRVRFANAREQVADAEAACWQEVVRTDFYQGVPVQMKVKEFVETEEYRRAKKALADLQEEFRRTGLPPGWAREQ